MNGAATTDLCELKPKRIIEKSKHKIANIKFFLMMEISSTKGRKTFEVKDIK